MRNAKDEGCIQNCMAVRALNVGPTVGIVKEDKDASTILGNFVCEPSFNKAECCYDLGDCITSHGSICPTCERSENSGLRNSYCNPELNDIQCCFDAGDCFQDRFQCLSCPEEMSWFRDNVCDDSLNNLNCCFDGGDCPCPSCPHVLDFNVNRLTKNMELGIPLYSMSLGNLQCDRLLNTPECCFDNFDCHLKNNR